MSACTPPCLFGAGMLGHTWVSTHTHDGAESIRCQVSYGADAVRIADDCKDDEANFYERVGRNKWRKRSRAYALLDQAPGRPYEPNMDAQP